MCWSKKSALISTIRHVIGSLFIKHAIILMGEIKCFNEPINRNSISKTLNSPLPLKTCNYIDGEIKCFNEPIGSPISEYDLT